jgi:hypothetical protein
MERGELATAMRDAPIPRRVFDAGHVGGFLST